MNTETPGTVFVIDSEAGMRAALHQLFESVHLQVATFAGIDDFLNAYKAAEPGCLLLEIRAPAAPELEFKQRLCAYNIDLPVIVTTAQASVPMAVTVMKQDAIDLIEKPFNEQQLLDCVQAALEHDRLRYRQRSYRIQVLQRAATLTAREYDVLIRIGQGMGNEAIAASLSLSHKTVAAYRARVMAKMQTRSLAQLIKMAFLLTADRGSPDG